MRLDNREVVTQDDLRVHVHAALVLELSKLVVVLQQGGVNAGVLGRGGSVAHGG